MNQYFAYIRVSTRKQEDGASLSAQRDAILTFAERNDIVISRWFEEVQTAAKRGRPVFEQMVKQLRAGDAAGLVIHKIDRSARNLGDWARIGELFDDGFDIRFANENLDFHTRGGRIAADFQAIIAADFIRNNREEAWKGVQGRLKQGLYPLKAPIGYLDNGKGKAKTIDPVRGPIVKQLFELYATGNYPLRTLRQEAIALGLRNYGGKLPSKTCLEKCLRNPFYMGVIHIRTTDQRYEGIHEPLITPALFDLVTAVRTGRYNKKVTKHTHRYRGLFRCGLCGTSMIPERQKGRVYYRCHESACATKTVREDEIEVVITSFLHRYTLTIEQITALKTRFVSYLTEQHTDGAAERAAFELIKLDERLRRLEDKLLDEVINDETYLRKKNEAIMDRQRWRNLAAQKTTLDEKIRLLDKFLELTKSLAIAYSLARSPQKREIVKFTTSNRRVIAKEVVFEPSKWMQVFQQAAKIDWCAQRRPTSRTLAAFAELLDTLATKEYQTALADLSASMFANNDSEL